MEQLSIGSPSLCVEEIQLDSATTEVDQGDEGFGGMEPEASVTEQSNTVVHLPVAKEIRSNRRKHLKP